MAQGNPQYEYTLSTNVGRLLRIFFDAEPTNRRTLTEALQVSDETINRVLDGELSLWLLTSGRNTFEKITGINLDRLQVIAAKIELATDPKVTETIPEETWQTRADIMEALRPIADASNCLLIADQIPGMSGERVNAWLRYATSHRLPDHENLKALILGLVRGFIPGNRNDVLMTLMRRSLLTELGLKEDPRPDVKTFMDLAHAILKIKGKRTDMQFAQATGLNRGGIHRLSSPDVNELQLARETMGLLLRILFDAIPAKKPATKKQSASPKPTAQPKPPDPLPAPLPKGNGAHMAPPITVAPAIIKETSATWHQDVASHLEAAARILREQAAAPSESSAPQAASTTDFTSVVAGDLPVGEDLEGVRFCITAASFKTWPGRQMSSAEQDDTNQLLTELRRRMNIIAGLDLPIRQHLLDSLAAGLDEFWHVLTAAKAKVPAGILEMLEHERVGFRDIRQTLQASRTGR